MTINFRRLFTYVKLTPIPPPSSCAGGIGGRTAGRPGLRIGHRSTDRRGAPSAAATAGSPAAGAQQTAAEGRLMSGREGTEWIPEGKTRAKKT